MPSELGSSIGRFGLIAAGGYAFGPIGAAVGALLGGFLFGPSGPDIEGPRLGDLDVSSSTYGGVIPLGFGVQKVAGTMIWATDIEEQKKTRTEGEGIFGWGGQDVTEYVYYGNFAVAFGEGPAVDVLRLWAGSKLIFDRRAIRWRRCPKAGAHHHVVRRDRERYDLVDDRRDMASRTPRAVRGRLLACLEHGGGDQHQRLVRQPPLGLGLLNLAGLQRRHRAHRVLRRILDPRHGASVARRSLRLPAPMPEFAVSGHIWAGPAVMGH